MYSKGINKADIFNRLNEIFSKADEQKLCVFLSHKKEDKPACKIIAEYLANAGIDYYLDEEDDDLQRAVSISDPIKITEAIKKGIKNSTHMLVVISEITYRSQWVSFEIGYGQAAIIDNQIITDKLKLSVLTLKDISEKTLPDFLQIAYIIKGIKSLNEYISQISNKLEKSMINESRIYSNSQPKHPLDKILNWKL
jgi:TIR domain